MQIGILNGHTLYVDGIAITSDNGYIVSVSDDKTVRIWDFKNQSIYAVLEGHRDQIFCVAITNDNKYAISGSKDNTIIIWSIQKKTKDTILKGHSSIVSGV